MRPRSGLRLLVAMVGLGCWGWVSGQRDAGLGHLRYRREVMVTGAGAACAALDAAVYAHAAASLKDLRLVGAGREIPYAITLSQAGFSETGEAADEAARVVDVRAEDGGVGFDLEMPRRLYTGMRLELGARDFVWTAAVSGGDERGGKGVGLGTFTVFDLTGKGLARSTAVEFAESGFRYLHVVLRGRGVMAGAVLGVVVPPSREAQTVYTNVARTGTVVERGRETVATFRVPARVPVERVAVEVRPGFKGDFRRGVRVVGRAGGGTVETVQGEIARVRRGSARLDRMGFAAALGVNLQEEATVEVAVEDGGDGALPVASVTLAMRERRICFDAAGGAGLALYYGDPGLAQVRYGYAPAEGAGAARLGAEELNPGFGARGEERTLVSRRPDLLWFLVLGGIGVVGTVALRGLRRRR